MKNKPKLFELHHGLEKGYFLFSVRTDRHHFFFTSDIDPERIFGKGRKREVTAERHRIWSTFFAWGYSYSELGRHFGFDHSSIIHGVKRYQKKVQHEREMQILQNAGKGLAA